ncbi:unnamed protein product [Closterium sp. NIES-54]
MLFHAAGAEGSRPTFFEMAAADFLPASLKAAALYALGVLAQHRPSLHRLLDHSDELSAAALLLLEWHSLKTHGTALCTRSKFGTPCKTFAASRPFDSNFSLLPPHLPTAFSHPSQAPHSASLCTAFAASPPFRTALHPAAHHYGQEPQQGEQQEGRRGQAEERGRQGDRKVGRHRMACLASSGRCLFSFWCCCPTCAPSCPLCLPPARGRGRDAIRDDSKHSVPSTTYQVLLPYLRAKLHALFAAHQRQRQARALWVGGEGGDDGWGGTGGEEEWGAERDGGNDAGPGHGYGDGDGYGDEYGGAMGGGEHSESGSSSPGSMGSVGSVRGHQHDGLGTEGFSGEPPGGGGVAAATARVTDGREEGGAGEEEVGGQGGQVVTGGAAAGTSHARGNAGRRSSAIGSSWSSARGSRRWRKVLRVLRWVQRRAVRGAAAAYPWVQAPYEGVCLLYQLLYVMDATPHYSPMLHLLSLSLRRATPQELAEASSSISTRRQREFERLPGSPAIRAVQAALLKALYFTMDYAQTSVIAAVFAFKMAEWWYQTGEQKLSAPTVYPPPPPPPPPKVAPAGIPVPADRSLCPLCLCRRTNPTAPGTSGFIFCYPCIFAYVDKFGRCPITVHPTTVDQLRRLFPDA